MHAPASCSVIIFRIKVREVSGTEHFLLHPPRGRLKRLDAASALFCYEPQTSASIQTLWASTTSKHVLYSLFCIHIINSRSRSPCSAMSLMCLLSALQSTTCVLDTNCFIGRGGEASWLRFPMKGLETGERFLVWGSSPQCDLCLGWNRLKTLSELKKRMLSVHGKLLSFVPMSGAN